MRRINGVVVAVALAVAAPAASAPGQHGAALGQRPIGQAAGTDRVTDAAQQVVVQVLCRGGAGLMFENRARDGASRAGVAMTLAFRRGDRPAGMDGRGLERGTCAAVARALGPMEPARIEFEIADASSIQTYLTDPGHVWRFDVVRSGGAFRASSNQPLNTASDAAQGRAGAPDSGNQPGVSRAPTIQQPANGAPVVNPAGKAALNPQPLPPKAEATLPANLFQMDDRAIIIIGGRQVAAGDVKRDILEHLPPSAPGRTFAPAARRVQPPIPAATAVESATISSPVLVERASGGMADRGTQLPSIDCSRSPLPGRMTGRLTPGEPLKIVGVCFGDAPGKIELIGQFRPSGTLTLSPLSWRDGEIVVSTPRDVRDVADHVVSLTVVRSDGKRSSARQATFVAARERIEVSSMWAPSPRYTWRGVYTDGYNPFKDLTSSYQSGSGQPPPSSFRLHVNPACWLDSMEANPRLGAVTDIGGWDRGAPNDANVNVFWTARKTTTNTQTPWS